MNIVSIVGARPQFVKLAPLDKKIRANGHRHTVIHTGQHYDYEMSESFFDELKIPKPDLNLQVGSGSHAQQTSDMLSRLGVALDSTDVDLVLVYGDTNSTLAGALAAIKLHIPIGHVEAGFRSGDISMPEEVNRILTDRVSQLLFAPTEDAVDNLVSEGISAERIFFVGNIMAESLLLNLNKAKKNMILSKLKLSTKAYGVLTVHRPENTDHRDRLTNIINGVIDAEMPFIFPLHPRTAKLLDQYGLMPKIAKSLIQPVSPMKYLEFMKVQSEARLILTDSGGIQEEAILLNVPCLTLRYNTEMILTLKLGANKLVGADAGVIKNSIREILEKPNPKFLRPDNWDKAVSARIMAAIDSNTELLEIKPLTVDLEKRTWEQ